MRGKEMSPVPIGDVFLTVVVMTIVFAGEVVVFAVLGIF
jgi:hypothetical protein